MNEQRELELGRMLHAVNRQREHELELRQALREIGERAAALMEDIAGRVRPLTEAMQQAGLLDEHPPTDPRARALWLRQHRGTGPARTPHAKRKTR